MIRITAFFLKGGGFFLNSVHAASMRSEYSDPVIVLLPLEDAKSQNNWGASCKTAPLKLRTPASIAMQLCALYEWQYRTG